MLVGRSTRAKPAIEDDLGYPRGCLNRDLQEVPLRREEHPQLQLLGAHLVSDSMCGLNEHFIGHALRVVA